MNALIQKLQAKLAQEPGNCNLEEVLQHLKIAQEKDAKNITHERYEFLESRLRVLERDGIIDAHDVSTVLEYLGNAHTQDGLHSARVSDDNNRLHSDTVRYVEANLADSTIPRLAIPNDSTTMLPIELIESLKQTYFLHMLATKPSKVLPSGKSLISVLSRPHAAAQQESSALQKRVENLVHKAFWEEAYELLSNPVPSVQIARLKRLYEDLYSLLSPLLPSNHPVIITLSLPLSPTSSPLRTMVTHIREIIHGLRERCAPSRDTQVDALMLKLDNASNPAADLARVVVDVVKAIMQLAEDMKDDLSQFVLGTMGEHQLHEIVAAQAAASERELILQLWRPPLLQQVWRRWIDEAPVESSTPHPFSLKGRFIHRLMQALGKNEAVYCNLPTTTIDMYPGRGHRSSPPPQIHVPSGNSLPPPLFFDTSALLLIQNYLQALVIAASLRSLVRLPARPISTEVATATQSSGDFLSRIWTLLKSAIEDEKNKGNIKVVNLADEVIRIRRSCSDSIDADEEVKLRAAVDRTLHVQDPVFQLLQRRLIRGIAEALFQPYATAEHLAPMRIRAGRSADSAKKPLRPLMSLDLPGSEKKAYIQDGGVVQPIVVKGFEDPVLVYAVGEIAARLRACVDWIEYVWSDFFEEENGQTAH